MVAAYLVLSGVGVILWIPILIRFYRSWIGRQNPISLAICAFVMMMIWFSVAGVWLVFESIGAVEMMLVSSALTLAIAIYSHVAFHLSEKRFGGTRRGGGAQGAA